MKSLFLAALTAFALFSTTLANAQQYRDSYSDSYNDSHSSAAYGVLVEVSGRSYNGRSNYYGGNRYCRDYRNYRNYRNYRYDYAPRRHGYRDNNNYTIYPGYRDPGYRPRNGYRHGRRN